MKVCGASLAPTSADFLNPVSCNQFVSLGQGMNAVPDPMFRRNRFGCGIENLLGFEVDGLVVFGEGGDDDDHFLHLVAPFFEGVF